MCCFEHCLWITPLIYLKPHYLPPSHRKKGKRINLLKEETYSEHPWEEGSLATHSSPALLGDKPAWSVTLMPQLRLCHPENLWATQSPPEVTYALILWQFHLWVLGPCFLAGLICLCCCWVLSFIPLSPLSLTHRQKKKNPLCKLIQRPALIKYQCGARTASHRALLAVPDYLGTQAEAATSGLEVCRD